MAIDPNVTSYSNLSYAIFRVLLDHSSPNDPITQAEIVIELSKPAKGAIHVHRHTVKAQLDSLKLLLETDASIPYSLVEPKKKGGGYYLKNKIDVKEIELLLEAIKASSLSKERKRELLEYIKSTRDCSERNADAFFLKTDFDSIFDKSGILAQVDKAFNQAINSKSWLSFYSHKEKEDVVFAPRRILLRGGNHYAIGILMKRKDKKLAFLPYVFWLNRFQSLPSLGDPQPLFQNKIEAFDRAFQYCLYENDHPYLLEGPVEEKKDIKATFLFIDAYCSRSDIDELEAAYNVKVSSYRPSKTLGCHEGEITAPSNLITRIVMTYFGRLILIAPSSAKRALHELFYDLRYTYDEYDQRNKENTIHPYRPTENGELLQEFHEKIGKDVDGSSYFLSNAFMDE